MKCIATFPAYELANSRQLDLLAANIDAVVWYVPTGPDQVYLGRLPIYALLVSSEQVEEAFELIRLVAEEDHRCLYGCPACGSSAVIELSQGAGVSFWLLMCVTFALPGLVTMLSMRARGRSYECLSCGTGYRLKP
ncbi:MAG TPA: hypothetical protein VG734_09270 [Lacunisphaera sp.]|nr:hypothetical protein [Lacunisphaera sp.]